MRRGGAAAAAHHRDMVLLDELGQGLGERLRLQRVDCLAIHVQRQPGVGNARHRQGRVLAQVGDRLAHMLGAGGTVQPDHIDAQLFQDGQGGAHIGAQQHAPGGVQGHLGLDGQDHVRLGKGLLDPGNGGLDLQDILGGLDQQQIHPALDQAHGLLAEHLRQGGKTDVGQLGVIGGGQLAGGADRAGHKAGLLGGGIFVGQAARQGGRRAVDLDHPLAQAVLAQGQPVGAEGIGLQHIHARLQEGAMHLRHRLGMADDQVIVTTVVALAAKIGRA